MSINDFDNLLNSTIDDYYNYLIDDEIIKKNLKKKDFGNDKSILNILISYYNIIDVKKIDEISNKKENIIILNEALKKYLMIYLFLYIGFFYTYDDNDFSKNLLNMTMGNINDFYKNLCTSENNSLIIKLFILTKNILKILNNENDMKNDKDMQYAMNICENLGEEYVQKFLIIKDKNEQCHNLLKTIILLTLYNENEKIHIHKLLEANEYLNVEFTYININIQNKDYIDLNNIKQILNSRQQHTNLMNDIWNIILDDIDIINDVQYLSEIITTLAKNNILIPIIDDFLLYHIDSEKYDYVDKNEPKIKYIVNKIDNAMHLNFDKKDDPFYLPMNNRKALLINNIENLKILNKIINSGKTDMNKMFNDLNEYNKFSYINFKYTDNHCLNINLKKNIIVSRLISYNNLNESNFIEFRMSDIEDIINIVGFVTCGGSKKLKNLICKQKKNLIMFDKNENNKTILNTIFKSKNDINYYWEFKNIYDFNEVENEKKKNEYNIQKYLLSFFKKFINKIGKKIVSKINKIKNPNLDKTFKIMNQIEKKYIKIPQNYDIYNVIMTLIYTSKYNKIKPTYNDSNDFFPGLSGSEIIKLPEIKKEILKYKIIQINKNIEVKKENESIDVFSVCQHQITWQNLLTLKQDDPKKYELQLFNFISKFVVENANNNKICISCGSAINISSYAYSGIYDKSNSFITYDIPLHIDIEHIQEYAKYKNAISGIDKLTEKIAIFINNAQLKGNNNYAILKRQFIIRNVIDMVTINFKLFNKKFKERNEKIDVKYGINKNLSNYFIFELDDNMFIYSSNDKDYYKITKVNNIICYIILFMLLDFNENLILNIYEDKKQMCNYNIFVKHGLNLFDNLKIIINDANDVQFINHYESLCYVIYIISCLIIKYNLWKNQNDNDAKKIKFDVILQKTLINTLINMLNNILENNEIKKNDNIYKIFSIRFFDKLINLHDNRYNNLMNIVKEKHTKFEEKKDDSLEKKIYDSYKLIPNQETYKFTFNKIKQCDWIRYFIKKITFSYKSITYVSNVTNCDDGKFHEWICKDKSFICKLCKKNIINNNYDEKYNSDIEKKNFYHVMNTTANLICDNLDVYDIKDIKQICTKISADDKYNKHNVFNNDDLNTLDKNIKKHKKQMIINYNKEVAKINDKFTNNNRFMQTLLKEHNLKFKKYENVNNIVKNFCDHIYDIVGKYMNLTSNIYKIKYDYLGKKLNKEYELDDKNIVIKNDHHYFKKNVIYFIDSKSNNTLYFDIITTLYIGYKDSAGKYILIENNDNACIDVNYSFSNKIIYLGFQNINQIVDKDNVKNIINQRILNLKKIIYNVKILIYNFFYKKKHNSQNKIDNEYDNDVKQYEKYDNVLQNIDIKINDNDCFLFSNKLMDALFIDEQKINYDNESVLNIEYINSMRNTDSFIIYYLINEIKELIDHNEKHLKTHILNFFIDFINIEFEKYNYDYLIKNNELSNFYYMLNNIKFIDEYENGEFDINDEYDEEIQKDEIEEFEALDIEDKLDFENLFDQYMNN
jgi:hypothetical protein